MIIIEKRYGSISTHLGRLNFIQYAMNKWFTLKENEVSFYKMRLRSSYSGAITLFYYSQMSLTGPNNPDSDNGDSLV